jgi:hypothetical protein
MNHIGHIAPVTDARAARLVSEDAFGDLAERIMSTPVPVNAAARPVRPRRRPVRSSARRPVRPRRRWFIVAPLTAGLALAMSIVGVVAQVGPGSGSPAMAEALTFHNSHGWVEVTVHQADLATDVYAEALQAHGLKLSIVMVPGSPSAVGGLDKAIPWRGGAIPVTAKGKCTSASVCPVGLKVPRGWHGSGTLVFCRPAKPGEHYVVAGPVTAPGEVMHGLRFRGRTVAWVRARLSQRHVAVAEYVPWRPHAGAPLPASRVPGSWLVYGAAPWAPQQVQLFVGPARRVQARLSPGISTLPSWLTPFPSR